MKSKGNEASEGHQSEIMVSKIEKKAESASSDSKTLDGEDGDSLEEQPLDIGEHYLVRRGDDTWRKCAVRRGAVAATCRVGGRRAEQGEARYTLIFYRLLLRNTIGSTMMTAENLTNKHFLAYFCEKY